MITPRILVNLIDGIRVGHSDQEIYVQKHLDGRYFLAMDIGEHLCFFDEIRINENPNTTISERSE